MREYLLSFGMTAQDKQSNDNKPNHGIITLCLVYVNDTDLYILFSLITIDIDEWTDR